MEEYHNVMPYFKPTSVGEVNLLARILNSLLDAINKRDHLPKMLIFVIDKDVVQDMDVYDTNVQKICPTGYPLVG